jgi:5-deoxy-D-glucuronate isomerase
MRPENSQRFGKMGYHAVSAPPGYDLYYLNVMAGSSREWKVKQRRYG